MAEHLMTAAYQVPINRIAGNQTSLAEYQGAAVGCFAADTPPENPAVVAAIEAKLAQH